MGSDSHAGTRKILAYAARCIAAADCDLLTGRVCRSINVGNRIVLCRISPCCGAHEDQNAGMGALTSQDNCFCSLRPS